MPRVSRNRTARLVLSMEPETKARLQAYAAERRSTASQLATEWIWSLPLKSDKESREAEDRV